MPKLKRNCLSCGKEFFSRKEEYCLQCKLKRKGGVHKKNEETHIHLVSKKVDAKEEVKGLLFLENRYPEVVEKIRKRETKANTEKFINENTINSNGD